MPDPAPLDAAGRKPVQVARAELPGVNALLTLAVGVVVVAALYLAQEVLIPITLAVLLSFLLAPVVSLLHRLHIGRVASVILAMLLAIGVILAAATLIGTQAAGLASNAQQYQAIVEHKVESVRAMTLGRLESVMQRLGQQLQPARPPAAKVPVPTGAPKPVQVEVEQPGPSPFALAERVAAQVVSPLGTLAIVLVVAVFILLQREDLRDRMIRLFGSGDLHRTTTAMNDAAARLGRYFLTQLGINAAFGLIIGCGLAVIGVPSAPLWGIVGMLLRFVPYLGAWLAAALPLLLAAAVEPGWSMLFWTAGLYAGTEFVMGQVVEPMLYGHSTGLSPFAVVVAATFWTWLWGPIGLILSTPLTLCLVVLGRHVDRLEFFDVLLGDRPALTPVESFYQRMLAGDPDEAHDQAEILLRDRALSTYYDEVLVKGLQLAASDALRGVLTELQVDRVKTAARHLIADLHGHEDRDPRAPAASDPDDDEEPSLAEQAVAHTPAPSGLAAARPDLPADWQGAAPVLCLAGRGPLDDAAAMALAQLLSKHDLPSRIIPHAAASRDAIGSLDLEGVAMVCIVYLEIDGTPSHLRYLLRRLRQQAPNVRILVGLWPQTDAVLQDERVRATIGADDYASTVGEAVAACLAASRLPPAAAEPLRAVAA
jgi:predicted PurR-regulated permease PerM